ncbi:Ig-like domain repeat protein, partial [Methanobrevibacter sp.]|uniref:Ig-like domain-containing protein n=1 Tax=Methanobrevibacter sp. TaxID=66852 RepID=UPI00386E05B9
VSKVVPSMSVSAGDICVGDVAKVIVELPSDASGNVTVNVDGKEITAVPVTNGNIDIFLSDLSSGNHSIEVTYSGDDRYASESADSSIAVEKKATHIKAANFNRLATDYYAGERGANHIGYLLDQNNNPVINRLVHIKVNGKVYDVKTNKKGAFKLQINLNTAKVYAYKITFKGDDSYTASSKSIKLKVTKKSTSIKASSKVFKARTKTKTIKITLKTVKNKYNGKIYLKKGKKITLKVKGKTYTAKTNAKGVAKFTIKLTKKGKYSATIKFSGDKTYKASSKKIKIKIK